LETKKNEKVIAVMQWVDAHQDELVKLLKDLIRIESVNPWFNNYTEESKETKLQEFLKSYVEKLGFSVDVWEPNAEQLSKYAGKPGYYPDRDFKNRANMCAVKKGTGGGRSLLLTGHIDVVSEGNGWVRKAFDPVVEDGKVYGRGAVDMKGGIASMVIAARAIIESKIDLSGDIKIGTVCDEEAGGMGTLAFIDRGHRADAAFMTEATDMYIAPLCRGILWGKLTLKGRSGHIEIKTGDWRNGGAVDAIALGKIYLEAIERKNSEWREMDSKNHPYLPIPCQINVAQINAGEYPTTYAGSCEIVFDIQYLPSERDENLLGGNVKRAFEQFIADVAKTNDWLTENPPEIKWMIDADCAETPVESDFVQCVVGSSKEIGLNLGIEGSQFHTDMGWFCNAGIPTINFGAGNPKFAHQPNEAVPVKDLVDATKVIAATIINWCK